jgi:hypothetical protein
MNLFLARLVNNWIKSSVAHQRIIGIKPINIPNLRHDNCCGGLPDPGNRQQPRVKLLRPKFYYSKFRKLH